MDVLSTVGEAVTNVSPVLFKHPSGHAWYERNKDAVREYNRKYREDHLVEKKAYDRAYYLENAPSIIEQHRGYIRKNWSKWAIYGEIYRRANSAKHNAYTVAWTKNNPAWREWSRRWARARQLDPMFRLGKNLRTRVHHALKGLKKPAKTESMLGCSVTELKRHLEKQFKPGMTWENYGPVWHVDHKIPVASAGSLKELVTLFRYTNLQPLWKRDNLSKGSKILDTEGVVL